MKKKKEEEEENKKHWESFDDKVFSLSFRDILGPVPSDSLLIHSFY